MAERLRRDPGVGATNVNVSSTQGVVELTGVVTNLLAKRRAVRVAEAVKGVRAVSDRIELHIEPRPDAEITSAVQKALLLDSAADSYEIEVATLDGQVTLSGHVQSYQERELAKRLAEGVSGVRNVDDRLRVTYARERTDEEVAADVRSRLRWDALVNDGLIRVSVEQGRVTLSGLVSNAAERRRATTDAWVVGAKLVDGSGLDVDVAADEQLLLRNKLLGKSDDQIAQAIRDAAAYDPRVSAADLQVSVNRGLATLRGSVSSCSARRAAEDLASHTVGVLAVRNEVQVMPREPVSDEQLLNRARWALFWDPYTDSFEISVEADQGKLTLRGSVATVFERAQATKLVGSIEGVKDVDNLITVLRQQTPYVYDPYYYPYAPLWQAGERTTPFSDAQIEGDVRSQLRWSPFVDAAQVKVEIKDGKAILTGQVDSESERSAATVSAFEGGAVTVDNRLRVEPPSEH